MGVPILGGGGGKFQSLSVTFTLRTSLQDVLGRPYMMSCIFFFILLTEYMDYKVVLIINDDAIPQTLIFIVDLLVMLQISKFWQSPKDVLMRCPVTFLAIALSRSRSPYLQKTLNYTQCRQLFVTRMQKRIRHSFKSLEDVHMRRPKTHFDTVL